MHIPTLYATPLINGGVVSEAISTPGEQDSYTFSANAGESVDIRAADINNSSLAPQLKLISPSGAVLFNTTGSTVAVIGLTVSSGGTYTVVVADGTQGHAQTGNYNLYFARMPGANEGGALPNGGVISDTVDVGDIDSYTFTANAGESVDIRAADINNSSLAPQLKLISPSGAVLLNTTGTTVAAIAFTAKSSGSYTVVVADGTQGHAQTGNYNLYFARMPGANEGGTLPNGGVVSGVIDIGDLDSYTFTANVGETAQIQVTDTGNSSYVPQLKLFSPSGAVIFNTSGTSVASFTYPVASNGTYSSISMCGECIFYLAVRKVFS